MKHTFYYEERYLWSPFIAACRDKRVKHLYVYGKTARVRKKNKKRAIEIGLEYFL